jgi:hypothetical protein
MKRNNLTPEAADAIAFKALAFLAEDSQRLGRFLSLTGLALDELRQHADETDTKCAVLDHLLQDESLLLVFAAHAGLRAEQIGAALRLISGTPAGDQWP